jgi:hypothetical protein
MSCSDALRSPSTSLSWRHLRRPRRLLLLCLALASACLSTPESTKEQARALNGMTDQGDDICAMEDWYGDGICDEFCPEADSDCVTCFAFPGCEADEVMYDTASECPQDTTCREVSLCGSTIWCSGGVACLAYPSCEPGDTAYEREEDCPASGACSPSSICGSTVWCHSSSDCAAEPVCGDGEIGYRSLEECGDDSECREETRCGSTIWCAPSAACLAFPSCNEGETARPQHRSGVSSRHRVSPRDALQLDDLVLER